MADALRRVRAWLCWRNFSARRQAVIEPLQRTVAQHATQALITAVVGAEQVAVFKQHGGVAQLQAVAFGQQVQVCRAGISLTEEKITVAVLVVHRARQGGEGGGNVGRVVHAPADFDGAEYGGEGGAVVGEEVVHALQAIGFLLGLGF